jgi:hypothetical protein
VMLESALANTGRLADLCHTGSFVAGLGEQCVSCFQDAVMGFFAALLHVIKLLLINHTDRSV